MNWKKHFIFGSILFFILGYFFLTQDAIELIFLSAVAGFSALLPDLDHELSKSKKLLDKLVPLLSFIVVFFYTWNLYLALLFTIFFSGIYFLVFTFLKPKHRGITHSLFALLILSIIIYLFDSTLSCVFFIGYLSHLLGDRTLKLF